MSKPKKKPKPAPLLDGIDEAKRVKLRLLGWHEVGGKLLGRPLWRRPGEQGAIDEEQAFRELESEGEGESGA